MRLFFLLAFLITVDSAYAQDTYNIIRVQGSIYNLTKKKEVAQGDKLTPNDKIEFKTPDAKALVISTQSGRFVISKSAGAQGSGSELVAFVKNVVLPMKSNGQLSTRGVETTAANNLKDHFGSLQYVIIGDVYTLKVSSEIYPMNDNQYFAYRYMYNGQAIVKRIDFREDTLVMDKNRLYQVDGKPIPADQAGRVEIYYLKDASAKDSQKLVNFKPVFVSEEELKGECKAMITLFRNQKMSKEDMYKQIHAYVSDAYGRVDETYLKNWINAHLAI